MFVVAQIRALEQSTSYSAIKCDVSTVPNKQEKTTKDRTLVAVALRINALPKCLYQSEASLRLSSTKR
jgi:hypothetical protein